jgi:xylulokinase
MIDWLRETLYAGAGDNGYEALIARAARAPVGSHGVVVAPHFQGAHIPQQDPMAKGAILGLRTGHTLDDITRALFEALAFQLRLAVDTYAGLTGETFPDVICIGGGSQNAFWVQMKADVLDRRIRVSALRENTAHGAALLAGIGAGVYRDVEEACALASPPLQDYLPNPAHVRIYGDIFEQVYCSLHAALAGVDQKLEALQARLAERDS